MWTPTLVIWTVVQLETVDPYAVLAWLANSTICVALQLVTSPTLSAESLKIVENGKLDYKECPFNNKHFAFKGFSTISQIIEDLESTILWPT